ncbi:MAG TPA: outer membrane lipoprotein carrier protein LolA [Sphingomicrobium sp.]|nr:outer membrane lipoprotein carrier protein LolA [Sphingomicrobium sp.]
MSLPTRFARAIVPVAIVATPVPALAASGDLAKIEAHLRATDTMTANFTQTDSKGQTLSGTLKLKRPGRIRFEYGQGVNVLLVADGKNLTFIDYEVGQKSSWALSKTPLGILLAPNPDIERIARIVDDKDPRVVVVRAQDPYHKEYGTLILAFIREASAPAGLRLYGWTAVDAQGKKTQVRLSDQHYNVGVPASAFTYAEPRKRGR